MPFNPGESGNLKGRPKGKRALTELLENAGSEIVTLKNGEKITRKDLLARMVWEVTTTGETTLANGKRLRVAPKDWFAIMQFIYKHIDGNPTQSLDVTSDGEPLKPNVYLPAVTHDNSDDPPTG